MRLGLAVVSLVLTGGCISSSSVDCSDGTTCPEGTACKLVPYLDPAGSDSACAAIVAQPERVCATPDQLSACSGQADRTPCTGGHCFAGVCLATTCGNCRVDRGRDGSGEVCDDGNTVSGDGCSFDCTSDETCGNHVVDLVRGELCDDGNHLSHDGCDSRCQLEQPVWTLLSAQPAPTPGARAGAGLAYDARTQHVVLFGGAVLQPDGSTVTQNDTWEWDGVGWTLMPTPNAPSPRSDVAMTYSDALGVVVMFGGTDVSGDKIGETWAWDGRVWEELAVPEAPNARSGATATYDSAREVVVMYGGASASVSLFVDTWELDANEHWTQPNLGPAVLPPGTVPMSYDPLHGVVIAVDRSDPMGTYAYDGTAWTQIASGGPTPRSEEVLVWDAATQTTLLFGGKDGDTGDEDGDQYAFDGSAWTEVNMRGMPPARVNPMIACDPVRQRVVMIGGDGSDDETWEWAAAGWRSLEGAVPAKGDVPMFAAIDRATATTLLTHVFDGAATDAFVFDGFAFSSVDGPGVDAVGALAWDDARDVAFLYVDGGSAFVWDGATWSDASASSGPGPTAGNVVIAYDSARAQIVLLDQVGDGDSGGSDTFTWLWDGTWHEAQAAHQPPPRSGAAMGYDAIREQVVMFSGDSDADTWLWDGADWTLAQPAHAPTARSAATLAWNAARGALVLFGGSTLGDTWEWTGSDWAQLDTQGAPDERQDATMWPTASGDGVRLFGGLSGFHDDASDAEEWLLRWQSVGGLDEACHASRDDDGDGLVGCADPDCWATCTPSCPPGETCDATAPRCGDGICNAALENCRNCPADCACTPVCGDFVCDPGEQCPGDCGS